LNKNTQGNQGIPTLFPYGAATQAEVINIIKMNCIESDVQNLSKTMADWRIASNLYLSIVNKESGIPDTINTKPIEIAYKSKLESISADVLFQQTFSYLQTEFQLVEINKLVAAQRLVNLDHVQRLKATLPKNPSMGDLIDFCLAPKNSPPEPKVLQLAQNAYSFNSESADFRFLGGFAKPLSNDDIKVAGGGKPVASIVLLVGYGSAISNAYLVKNRIILNNGFHRMFTLADMGIQYAPVLIQKISNPDLEFPPHISGLPKDYLIDNPRPVIMKDFVDKTLFTVISKKPTMKNLQIAWNAQETSTPI